VRIAPRRASACLLLLGVAACDSAPADQHDRHLVVTTVAPITDIARNVAGRAAEVEGVVPEGVDSHTFEPTADTVRLVAEADLVLVNGLGLEEPTVELARADVPGGTPVYALGDAAVDEADYVYDFSFPESGGRPNPHLWMSVPFGIEYARLIADRLAAIDEANAALYEENASDYVALLERLDSAIRADVATVPPANRVLLTYHDSFAYFAREYGFRVIGAIQPSDFAEPSAREVAELIDQIREEDVPVIFGSEVFPSPVLEQIAREAEVDLQRDLRDDDLPGEPGDPDHSYVGLMAFDATSIVEALGGEAAALRRLQSEEGAG
jgi:ABC-type Zn uptake system ZnuABC Zn-binding protein ZnuA